MNDKRRKPFVWVIAGEPSGDLIGARLIAALQEREGGDIRLAGIGGEAMAAGGLDSLFSISDVSVMGLVEIIPRIPLIKRRIRDTIKCIKNDPPDIVVSIDAPGFSYRIWKGLRDTDIPLVHYVAPTVWAWRPGRAKKFAAELDHLMALLPFEPQYFEREGLATTFVGHPVLEGQAGLGAGAAFRTRHDIGVDANLVAVLPGSRRGEVVKLLPVFRAVSRQIARRYPDTVFVFPTVSYLTETIIEETSGWPGRTIVLGSVHEKYDAFAASAVAMAASGTVSLELAMARVPHVIAYRMNPVTVAMVKMMRSANQKYANLLNILLNREAVPEFIQGKCKPDLIARGLLDLIERESGRQEQMKLIEQALEMLRPRSGTPSVTAAYVVMSFLGGEGNQGEEFS